MLTVGPTVLFPGEGEIVAEYVNSNPAQRKGLLYIANLEI